MKPGAFKRNLGILEQRTLHRRSIFGLEKEKAGICLLLSVDRVSLVFSIVFAVWFVMTGGKIESRRFHSLITNSPVNNY